jgi:hypothetical protein
VLVGRTGLAAAAMLTRFRPSGHVCYSLLLLQNGRWRPEGPVCGVRLWLLSNNLHLP